MCVLYVYCIVHMMSGSQPVGQKVIQKGVSFELIKVVNIRHFHSAQHVSWANIYVMELFLTLISSHINSYLAYEYILQVY